MLTLVVLFAAASALRDAPILTGGKPSADGDTEASRKHTEARPTKPCASDVLTGGDCDEGPPVELSDQLEGASVNEVGWLSALLELVSQPGGVQRVRGWWSGLFAGARASLKSNRTYDKGRMSRDQKDFHKPRPAPRGPYEQGRMSRDQKDFHKKGHSSVLETDSSGNVNFKAKKSNGTKFSRDQKNYAKAKPAVAYNGSKLSRDQKDYAKAKPAPAYNGSKLSRDQKDYAKAKPARAYDGSKLSRDQKDYAKEKPAPSTTATPPMLYDDSPLPRTHTMTE